MCANCGRVRHGDGREGARSRRFRPLGFAFQLDSLLMLMVLVGAWLMVLRASAPLAVLAAFLAIPALARTYVAARKHWEADMPLGKRQKVVWFLASLGLMMFVALAWVVAFASVAIMTFLVGLYFGDSMAVVGAILGLNLGLLCATIASVQVARWLWPLGWAEPISHD